MQVSIQLLKTDIVPLTCHCKPPQQPPLLQGSLLQPVGHNDTLRSHPAMRRRKGERWRTARGMGVQER